MSNEPSSTDLRVLSYLAYGEQRASRSAIRSQLLVDLAGLDRLPGLKLPAAQDASTDVEPSREPPVGFATPFREP
jgi:hypothetical protein